jgi:uncharacterized protein YuzE
VVTGQAKFNEATKTESVNAEIMPEAATYSDVVMKSVAGCAGISGAQSGGVSHEMTERSLQVTYSKGKAFSAYLHLSHQTGEKSVRTVPSTDGLIVIDYGQNGNAIGVEITAPSGRGPWSA